LLVQEHITEQVIAAAIEVHTTLVPGLLESVYEECMAYELASRALRLRRQVQVPVTYGDRRLDCGFRVDLLVEDEVVVELKAVDRIRPIHEAQLMTYLRLAAKPVGLLINFNVLRLKDGIVRRAMTHSFNP
jgi:GxxExxY protein